MKTNDIKKGMKVLLRGTGWTAILEDNRKGNTRLATVYGFETEMGSIYAHDIECVILSNGCRVEIEYTPSQLNLREICKEAGW